MSVLFSFGSLAQFFFGLRYSRVNSKHLIRWAQVCCWTAIHYVASSVIAECKELLRRGATVGLLCSVHCPRNNRGWCPCHIVTPSLSFCPLKAPAVWLLKER